MNQAVSTAPMPDAEIPEALALVSQGEALLRVENEQMQKVARLVPRDERRVLAGAVQELELVPTEAAKAYYSIPYKDTTVDPPRTVKVEGMSINAAMALARRWGNCTTSVRILREDETGWDLEGVFLDLETNFRVSRPQRASKLQRRRHGGTVVLDAQRQIMVLGANASKAARNAILAGLPIWLKSAYWQKARALASGQSDLSGRADPGRVKAVLESFARLGVTPEQLEKHLGIARADWTGEEIAELRGVWNAINDGERTAAQIFSDDEPVPEAGGPVTITVTPESIAQGATTGQDGQTPGASPEPPPPGASAEPSPKRGPGRPRKAAPAESPAPSPPTPAAALTRETALELVRSCQSLDQMRSLERRLYEPGSFLYALHFDERRDFQAQLDAAWREVRTTLGL